MTRRVAAAAAAVAVLLGGTAASASTPRADGALTISASRTAAATFTLTRRAALWAHGFDPFDPPAAIHRTGTTGGLLLLRDGRFEFLQVDDAALDQPLVFGAYDGLPAGHYTAVVVGTGPTRVRLPLFGSRQRLDLRRTRPVPLGRTAAAFAVPLSPAAYFASPMRLGPGTTLVMALTGPASTVGPMVTATSLCVQAQPVPCELPGPVGEGGAQTVAVCFAAMCSTDGASAMVAEPGGLPPGRYYAVADEEQNALQRHPRLLTLTIG